MHQGNSQSFLAALLLATFAWSWPAVSRAALAIQPYDSYKRLTVTTSAGRFAVDLVTVSLKNPKLKVYTYAGTDGTNCYNRVCAVRPLKAYRDAKRGFAAINGSYFCPRDYSTCGPAGNYYWMVYNHRTKKLINEFQNKFNAGGGILTFAANKSWHFYRVAKTFPGKSALQQVDGSPLTALMSNGPTLMDNGKYVLNPAVLDSKSRFTKSNRSGVAIRGTRLYLMVARKATVEDLGRIMQKLGMQFGLNLDGGGSSALWYRGAYQAGPGRDLPNAIVVAEN
ncbi:MAG: phosphodiester glycosidase family protein [Candidatus Kerfeldbacteria bacterium]|nr:phosphodiester glycosidase family protein [Candidatus Kerfeldbacteria bacterium]